MKLRILLSSGDPFLEIVTTTSASPAQTQVTSAGQRESFRTSSNLILVPFPLITAVLPTGSENATPGSAAIVGSTAAQLARTATIAPAEINARPHFNALLPPTPYLVPRSPHLALLAVKRWPKRSWRGQDDWSKLPELRHKSPARQRADFGEGTSKRRRQSRT